MSKKSMMKDPRNHYTLYVNEEMKGVPQKAESLREALEIYKSKMAKSVYFEMLEMYERINSNPEYSNAEDWELVGVSDAGVRYKLKG